MVQSAEKSLEQLRIEQAQDTQKILAGQAALLDQFRPHPPEDFIFKVVRDSGGSARLNAAATTFDYIVPIDMTSKIARITIAGFDNAMILANGFFTLPELTNGILLQAVDTDGSTVIKDFLDGETVKAHAQFGLLAGVDVFTEETLGVRASWRVRWTLSESGAPLLLTAGQSIRLTVQDDLSDLEYLQAMVQGMQLPVP